jgi:hypothetical protein
MPPFFRYGPYLPAHMALCGLGPIYPRTALCDLRSRKLRQRIAADWRENDMEAGSYRFVRRINTDKRACVHQFNSTWTYSLVGLPDICGFGLISTFSG